MDHAMDRDESKLDGPCNCCTYHTINSTFLKKSCAFRACSGKMSQNTRMNPLPPAVLEKWNNFHRGEDRSGRPNSII